RPGFRESEQGSLFRRGILLRLGPIILVVVLIATTSSVTSSSAATIITVTTTTDELTTTTNGVCSLREAIRLANGDPTDPACGVSTGGPFTINLANGVTYSLTLVGANEDAAATGDLDIKAGVSVVLQVSGGGSATINGNATDRIFQV